MTTNDRNKMANVITELKARGGQDQLLMFLTGPAGAGKSTAVQVAKTFCFEFSVAVGNLWNDNTFFYTAYTGSAASLFGGRTIVKAAFISKPAGKSLTGKEKKSGNM